MVKNLILFSAILLMSYSTKRNSTNGQDSSCSKYYDKPLKMVVYTDPSELAEYPGGMQAILRPLHALHYPKQDELQLKVRVCFVVDTMGKLKDVRVDKKEVSAYSKLDIEVVKMLRQMRDDWKPGKCNGKKVVSIFSVPIGFEVTQ